MAPRLCLLAPSATPTAVVDSLSEAVRQVLESSDTVAAALRQGAVPAYLSANRMVTDLPREVKEWAGVIQTQNIGES